MGPRPSNQELQSGMAVASICNRRFNENEENVRELVFDDIETRDDEIFGENLRRKSMLSGTYDRSIIKNTNLFIESVASKDMYATVCG